ncbi:MarR family winged helix-turn-helix transcriptional regulator [Clostridium sp. AM33-3]|jgi:DNA-binding MarR family transcriptional regulator|uniref:MarR family winged helix-turn-helix transcriptional regulator n=1 Tax=Clostridium sp. AM33-3 TaxID=2292304 RepID=UPI000E52CAE6|nr:MarR family winged helix-turn-helix transcriptional regulator [Clostridium sp. AM33-3]RHT22586.1 MarR family transcriptional regulator [Clostridium sp. AM33-3]
MKQQEERIAMRSIKRLSNGISREMCAAFGSGMFSGAQGRTLHFLLAHTKIDIFQKDIEEEFGLRPPTATALLKELEQRGLIRKEPVPYDARKKKIVVTEEALQYKDCVLKGLEELNQKLTAGISDEEMQVFFSVTDKMLKNLAK